MKNINYIISSIVRQAMNQHNFNDPDCRCNECENKYNQEYQKWKDDIDEYCEKRNFADIDKAIMFLHGPDKFLRLPKHPNIQW